MPSPVRSAWLDAWEGASTPSPSDYHGASRRSRGQVIRPDYEAWAPHGGRGAGQTRRPALDAWRPRLARGAGSVGAVWPEETLGSVVRLSEARRREVARQAASRERNPKQSGGRQNGRRGGKPRRQDGGSRGRQETRYEPRIPERLLVPDVAPISDYDWEAAARRRPAGHECERVILHAERSIEARMSSTRYYGREATARVAQPWPEAPRRQATPRLRVVKRRVARRRLAVLAVAVGLLLVGSTIVAPMMTSAAVAGVETAVGQAEALQEQLAAETAALASQISSLSSPQRVAEEAAQLGLAPAQEVSYVSPELSGGPMLASEGDTTLAGR